MMDIAYSSLINLYSDLFGRDRLLVLPYEMLTTDREAFMTRILMFSDIPNPTQRLQYIDFDRHINRHISPMEIQMLRWMRTFMYNTKHSSILNRGYFPSLPKHAI